MWPGVTEGNLERVLNLLKAMSPIAVIVDEADAQLGNRSSSGDSGVGNRVFAQIAAFMRAGAGRQVRSPDAAFHGHILRIPCGEYVEFCGECRL
jgi:SpoVK/Ycf46/Vps4 family AAA+-type ATPase